MEVPVERGSRTAQAVGRLGAAPRGLNYRITSAVHPDKPGLRPLHGSSALPMFDPARLDLCPLNNQGRRSHATPRAAIDVRKPAEAMLNTGTVHAGVESSFAWWRLTAAVAVGTLGGVGSWSVPVVLPAVQAEFGVARADAALPYTLAML